jgi:CheY-like chemotaxis protein
VANLLVVDDDPDLAELLTGYLESEGHIVRVAHDGGEGLRLVSERQPDLVLLDVEMPFVSGPQMSYQMVLRDCGEEQIPVVLLSAVTNLHRTAARVGTPYFLGKPFDPAALSRLVARALAERHAPSPGPGQAASP